MISLKEFEKGRKMAGILKLNCQKTEIECDCGNVFYNKWTSIGAWNFSGKISTEI